MVEAENKSGVTSHLQCYRITKHGITLTGALKFNKKIEWMDRVCKHLSCKVCGSTKNLCRERKKERNQHMLVAGIAARMVKSLAAVHAIVTL